MVRRAQRRSRVPTPYPGTCAQGVPLFETPTRVRAVRRRSGRGPRGTGRRRGGDRAVQRHSARRPAGYLPLRRGVSPGGARAQGRAPNPKPGRRRQASSPLPITRCRSARAARAASRLSAQLFSLPYSRAAGLLMKWRRQQRHAAHSKHAPIQQRRRASTTYARHGGVRPFPVQAVHAVPGKTRTPLPTVGEEGGVGRDRWRVRPPDSRRRLGRPGARGRRVLPQL